MKCLFRYPIILFLSFATIGLQVKATPTHGHKQHKAHLHGSAELMLAIGVNSLEISLESPATNIVGFEHPATSPEQINTAMKARSTLNSAERLFSFVGSSCTLERTSIDMSTIIEQDKAHGENENHHSEDSHHDHHDDAERMHSEISATYHYNCENSAKITGILVNLHKYFPAIEKLKVMWLTDSTQGAAELTRKSNFIRVQ